LESEIPYELLGQILRMNAPIFIDHNGDLTIFRSVEAAQSYLEPEDAADSRTRIYDVDGRKLIGIHERQFGSIGGGRRIRLASGEEVPAHGDELQGKLLRFLEYIKCPEEALQAASLSRLVELSLPHASG